MRMRLGTGTCIWLALLTALVGAAASVAGGLAHPPTIPVAVVSPATADSGR